MPRIFFVLSLLALALMPGCRQSVESTPSPPPPSGHFSIEYAPSQVDAYRPYRDRVVASKRFDEAAERLNNRVRLPHDLKLAFQDKTGPHFDSRLKTLFIPYGYCHYAAGFFEASPLKMKVSPEEAALDVIEFVFYHELGHALIEALDLPVVGREEDAVDDLATLLALEVFGRPEMAARTALAFHLMAKSKKAEKLYDLHSLDEQRFYRILQILYGAKPGRFLAEVAPTGLVEPQFLDKKGSAQKEYRRLSRNWRRLLKPHLEPAPSPAATQ